MTGTRWRTGAWAMALGVAGALLAAPAGAQQGGVMPAGPPPAIRVSGTGEVQVRPDQAQIHFAVESFASTARDAGQQNARTMERVIQALVAAGVPRGDIETRNYSLFPEYAQDEARREQRITGYRAMNQVTLRTTSLDRVGALIDAALSAGANRMDGISFELRDPAAAQAEALRRAVARARTDAETMAAALGVRLGNVLEASTATDVVRPVPMMMAKMEMAAASTPIEPGEQTVRASASVAFAIVPGR